MMREEQYSGPLPPSVVSSLMKSYDDLVDVVDEWGRWHAVKLSDGSYERLGDPVLPSQAWIDSRTPGVASIRDSLLKTADMWASKQISRGPSFGGVDLSCNLENELSELIESTSILYPVSVISNGEQISFSNNKEIVRARASVKRHRSSVISIRSQVKTRALNMTSASEEGSIRSLMGNVTQDLSEVKRDAKRELEEWVTATLRAGPEFPPGSGQRFDVSEKTHGAWAAANSDVALLFANGPYRVSVNGGGNYFVPDVDTFRTLYLSLFAYVTSTYEQRNAARSSIEQIQAGPDAQLQINAIIDSLPL